MSETLNAEIRDLASLVAACEDEDVADSGEIIARLYRRERRAALGLIGVHQMVSGQDQEHDEYDPQLVACRARMRDRLKGLLTWAKAKGRM